MLAYNKPMFVAMHLMYGLPHDFCNGDKSIISLKDVVIAG